MPDLFVQLCRDPEFFGPGCTANGVHEKRMRHALRAHMWGLRVAMHVSGGCVESEGGWTDKYTDDVPWVALRTHRRWCPDELPEEHDVLCGLINSI